MSEEQKPEDHAKMDEISETKEEINEESRGDEGITETDAKPTGHEEAVREEGHLEKKGRGRPKKQALHKKEEVGKKEEGMEEEESKEKKGRGRPKKSSSVTQEAVENTNAGKRQRSKIQPLEAGSDENDKSKTKKPRVKQERSIEPGKLRNTPRRSYKDDSSDEEVNKYLEPDVDVSSDGEADLALERRLSGKGRPEKKEAGALRARKRMSYKDESESDIESGFESDGIATKKSKPSAKKGRGRPRKQEVDSEAKEKKRGRKKIHADKGPYVPSGKPRGRPKGSKKISEGQSIDENEKEDQSEEGEATLSTDESMETTAAEKDVGKTATDRENTEKIGSDDDSSEENSDKETGENAESGCEKVSEITENCAIAVETPVS